MLRWRDLLKDNGGRIHTEAIQERNTKKVCPGDDLDPVKYITWFSLKPYGF